MTTGSSSNSLPPLSDIFFQPKPQLRAGEQSRASGQVPADQASVVATTALSTVPDIDSSSKPIPQVSTTSAIQSEVCKHTLGKVEKFFLKFKALFSSSAKDQLKARIEGHKGFVKDEMGKYIEGKEKGNIGAHKGFSLADDGLAKVSEDLLLNQKTLKESKEIGRGKVGKTVVAEWAIAAGTHKNLSPLEVKGLGTLKPYTIGNDGKPVEHEVTPTSYSLGDPENKEDHLTNVYVLEVEGQKFVIRSGRIDTEERSNDFLALIKDIHAKFVEQTKNPDLKLRIVSQQLNSFETESKMIDGQHYQISRINNELKGMAEVVHINIPSNRWYNTTKGLNSLGLLGKLIKKLTPGNFFKGEELSKAQNLDSWGVYSKWVGEDLKSFRTSLKENENLDLQSKFEKLSENQTKRNTVKMIVDDLLEKIEQKKKDLKDPLMSKAEKSIAKAELKEHIQTLRARRADLRYLLKEDYDCFQKIENELNKIQNPSGEILSLLQTVSLMRQVLGSQLDIPGEVMDRGQEGMAIQLLNDLLGVSAALNCKSGLDRTGFWHAQKLAQMALEKEIGPERTFTLVTEWEKTTDLLNKMTARLKNRDVDQYLTGNLESWKKLFGDLILAELSDADFIKLKEKISDVISLRKKVLENLITQGIPITAASTGVLGLKWNTGREENLIPLNFLPSHVLVKQTEDNINKTLTVPLVKLDKKGKIAGISKLGRGLITKLQKLRGS